MLFNFIYKINLIDGCMKDHALNLNSFNNVKNFEQDTIKREKKATQ